MNSSTFCKNLLLHLALGLMASLAFAQTSAEARFYATDGSAYDVFGRSVSVSGKRALVGAMKSDHHRTDAGAAYVFEQTENGRWHQVAKLQAKDAAAYDQFGSDVALDGDRALVGAIFEDGRGEASGAAYIFERRNDGVWTQTAKLLAMDGQKADHFGSAVALSGDRAIVGAFKHDEKGQDAGAAYVFERVETGQWQQSAKLTAKDGEAYELFGYSVDISGDRAIVGMYGDNDLGVYSGSAYVFTRNKSGNWEQSAKLFASDGQIGDLFGYSVAISGIFAVVGAHGEDAQGDGSGAAYVFEMTYSGDWIEKARLDPDYGAIQDNFGISVDMDGSYALIGANAGQEDGQEAGAAYLFRRSRSGHWVLQTSYTPRNTMQKGHFGHSVALSQNTVLVGAKNESVKGKASGSAHLFRVDEFARSATPYGSD